MEAAKLPGLLLMLRLAVALHGIVNTPGRVDPFPTVAEIEASADVRAWRTTLSSVDVEPFFHLIGTHVRNAMQARGQVQGGTGATVQNS